MKVYLDNNIIVGVENGDYEISPFIIHEGVDFYYSAAHIEELIEGSHIKYLSVDKRLSTIDEICGFNHILNGCHEPEFYPKAPKEMYDIECSPILSCMRGLVNNRSALFNVNNKRFLEILKLRRIDVNNIKTCSIILEIDRRLQSADDPRDRISVKEYLQRTEATGQSVYATLFNLLDFACFYRDKPTDHSNIARLHDASHAYYAQLCDVFVSDDKRMRFKTEAVYSYLGVKTRVISGKEFLASFKNYINNH